MLWFLYRKIKGLSILSKILIIYILFYFVIGAVLIRAVPNDLYIWLIVTGITFIGVILISKEYFKNNFVNHSMLVMEKQFKNDNYLILSCNDL